MGKTDVEPIVDATGETSTLNTSLQSPQSLLAPPSAGKDVFGPSTSQQFATAVAGGSGLTRVRAHHATPSTCLNCFGLFRRPVICHVIHSIDGAVFFRRTTDTEPFRTIPWNNMAISDNDDDNPGVVTINDVETGSFCTLQFETSDLAKTWEINSMNCITLSDATPFLRAWGISTTAGLAKRCMDVDFVTTVLFSVDSGDLNSVVKWVSKLYHGADHIARTDEIFTPGSADSPAIHTNSIILKCYISDLSILDGITGILRSNTTTTKLLSQLSTQTHIGLRYLVETVGPILKEIAESEDESYELNPNRVTTTPATLDTSLPSQVDEQIVEDALTITQNNANTLMRRADQLFDAIIKSVDRLPPALTRTIALLVDATTRHFDKEDPQVLLRTVMAGFLFLRYICPAFILPEVVYGDKHKTLSISTQKRLLVLAKCIQNVANNVRFGQKESHMVVLNDWVSSAVPKSHQLFDNVYKLGRSCYDMDCDQVISARFESILSDEEWLEFRVVCAKSVERMGLPTVVE